MSEQCPATTRTEVYRYPTGNRQLGLQCKYTAGHEGDHAADGQDSKGDVFWPQAKDLSEEEEGPESGGS